MFFLSLFSIILYWIVLYCLFFINRLQQQGESKWNETTRVNSNSNAESHWKYPSNTNNTKGCIVVEIPEESFNLATWISQVADSSASLLPGPAHHTDKSPMSPLSMSNCPFWWLAAKNKVCLWSKAEASIPSSSSSLFYENWTVQRKFFKFQVLLQHSKHSEN
jgi:hypothetical protein